MTAAILALLGSQATVLVLAIISGAVTNRALGPVVRGDYAEIVSWISISATVCGLSAATAIYHYSNQRTYAFSRGELFGSVLALWALAIFTASLLYAACLLGRPSFVSPGLMQRAPLVFMAVIASIGFTFFTTLLKVSKAFRTLSLSLVGMQLATTIVILSLAAARALDVTALLAVITCSQLLAAMTACVILVRYLEWRPIRARLSLLRRLILSGLQAHIATVATLLYVRFDQILVYHMANAAETGIYAVAVTIVTQLMVLPMTIQEVLYPRVIEAETGGDAEVTVRVTQFTLIAFGACVVVIWLLAGPLVTIYAGHDFDAVVPLVRWLLPGVYFFCVPNLLSPYWTKRGYFLLGSLTAILLLALNLVLNWLWIPQHGALGAAWATTATYFVGMCTSLALFSFLSGRNSLTVFLVRRDDFLAVCRSLYAIVKPHNLLIRTSGR
jgi:O-antigen/teichoic acid export membrane protein